MNIMLFRETQPSSLAPYGDRIRVVENNIVLYSGSCSTNPNPFKPTSPQLSWKKCYAQVTAGTYQWSYDTMRHSFGSALLVTNKNGELEIPTTCANVNQGGKHYAIGIFLHKGYSMYWRGSKACFTIPPKDWMEFYSLFKKGDRGDLVLVDLTRKAV